MEAIKKKYQKYKTEKKIVVEYKLNKRVSSIFQDANKDSSHPIYIEIRVRRQNTSIKSRLNTTTTEIGLKNYLEIPYIAKFIEHERKMIENTIREFNPDEDDNFKISEWSEYYRQKINENFEELLNNKLYNLIDKKIYEIYKTSSCFSREGRNSSIEILNFLDKLNIPFAKDFLNYYQEVFDLRKIFIEEQNVSLIWMCLEDWNTGYYQNFIKEFINPKDYHRIVDKVNSLLAE